MKPRRGTLFLAAYVALLIAAGGYFTYAAVQGDYGLFRRSEILAEEARLTAEKARLEAEIARLRNLTRRLSDASLDLDLLDERARAVLGLIRPDERVLH